MPPQNQNPYQPQPGQGVPPQQPAPYGQQYNQPLQPLPPQQGSSINPQEFEFIMNPQQQKRSLGLGFGSSKKSSKLLLIIGALVIVVILLLGVSSLFKKSTVDTAAITNLAQQQTEIVRISALAIAQPGSSQKTKNIAQSAQLVVGSDQNVLLDYVGKSGVKINPKQLALGRDTKTDEALKLAGASGSYDEAFQTALKTDLQKYSEDLTSVYKDSKSSSLRNLLSDQYDNADLLLQQIARN